MKVLQVISHYLPALAFGGPLRVAHSLSQELVRAGHEVTVVCTDLAGPSSRLPLDKPVACIDGVTVYYERAQRPYYWGFSAGLAKRVFQEAASADVVCTHFHYQFASVVGGLAARLRGKPLVVFAHGSLNRDGIRGRRAAAKYAYLQLLERRNFRRATYTVYHSELERERSVRFGGSELIVPIGVPLVAAGRRRDPAGPFTFGYLGRVARGKGLDLLVTAVQRLRAEGRDAVLVIAGPDERGYRTELESLASRLDVAKAVVFAGLLNDEEKYTALSSYDVFVLPSISEGSSISTLEAMSVGVPVIITDRTCSSSEVEAAACGFVIPYDVEALIDAMRKAMCSTDLADMGERGRRQVTHAHDWAAIAADFVSQLPHGPEVLAAR